MYNRTLQGYQEAIKPEHLPTYLPALNTMCGLAALFDRQHRIEDAKLWYSKALAGYEKVRGTSHLMCQRLRNKLNALRTEQDDSKPASEELSGQESSTAESSANIGAGQSTPGSGQQKLLGKRKRD
ncbi:hypothetical protein BS50DRAFT_317380 [Corynespora cassiicola Philippines]|uniref:Tetratricopeptide repeat domain-containing protein n=1 Tax=Corynespora cassiicola Philippines TaxID=1448308 RepID=A0A2T2N0C5_CORCC|nr:hypothetical protein BS50DRAFT_317380 [Corynespora cassiicola Philippines]